jgi:hypothetical protein
MRTSFLALFSLTAGLAAAAPSVTVQLDRPGVLDSIRAERPDHYYRIAGILRIADTMPCHTPQFGHRAVEYEARDARCGLALLTSYPAKRRLSFVLDEVAYVTTVTMRDSGGRLLKVPTGAAK